MHLFYSTSVNGNAILLDKDESRHLAKVLRLNIGDEVISIDGKGTKYFCEVALNHDKKSLLTIRSKEVQKKDFGIELGVAPTKNLNRWEWFLEKATELGIDAIHPIQSYHSERKILKRDRQERILVAAMKQSYKSKLPHLSDLTPLKEIINSEFEGQKFVAHCYDDIPKQNLKACFTTKKKALILIGPEGDFSRQEVEQAISKGFEPINLGKSRLRTETAAIIACHSILLLNE